MLHQGKRKNFGQTWKIKMKIRKKLEKKYSSSNCLSRQNSSGATEGISSSGRKSGMVALGLI